ncbi:hypothetical protein [Duganella sp. Root1480D1]|uniref:hypothetical protein n=1 Tax=Duganella sp. Root1480D1 TaxID=1736471 RepID=UPI00071021B9|nr:hypothetical protein [Duganella sp. Root1480D1]KQZ29309.1 hypothetical protein ASD58_30165 [Duganella sp. Root1480D1]
METKNTPLQFSDELNDCIGRRVVKLVRYSWWPKEEISAECGIASELSFSLTAGPLEVVFDDESSLGIASDPSLNSVIVWWERESGGRACVDSPLAADAELYPVSADDEEYASEFWRKLLKRKLIEFSIYKKRLMGSLESELPSELGLHFIFEDNLGFIASHGLHDGSDDFSVLMLNQFADTQKDQLVEIPL